MTRPDPTQPPSPVLGPVDVFATRHLGPGPDDVKQMLRAIGVPSLHALVEQTIPSSIRLEQPLQVGSAQTEAEALRRLHETARKNRVLRSFIGMGYSGCVVPGVIARNVLENPGWYTAYTPYQAEIAQGRLEALPNFQTAVSDLTGLPLCNASLLDEATAAAEAMAMCHRALRGKRRSFFVDDKCHPQTIALLHTRADGLDIEVHVGDRGTFDFAAHEVFGALFQYPDTQGVVADLSERVDAVHAAGGLAVVATDLLSLTLLKPPGEFGADVAVGSAQRFGVPMGYGGPHAAFLTTSEAYKRHIPGRIIGVSRDAQGNQALRMAMQTREQHIRRERATSNICTAQVLLAVMASMYAVYHGPSGLRAIAARVHEATRLLAAGLRGQGHAVGETPAFDTVVVEPSGKTVDAVMRAAVDAGYNLRKLDERRIAIALDETVQDEDVVAVLGAFGDAPNLGYLVADAQLSIPDPLRRTTEYLTHPVFHQHRAEHEMLRYIKRLENRDLSLVHSMIPLGSCTMKLNATAEMVPVSWPELSGLHPFVPVDQAQGYAEMMDELERWLCDITGFARVSLQPNAGAQGEYAGLMVIRAYHQARGQGHRNVCLIPVSAHGTNPASAVMAGMKVVVVACDEHGNIDVADLEAKATEHADNLAALMVTYPSTHGVFEEAIVDVCRTIHERGGQVYLDGANMNAQVGLCRPGDFGADVCHLNLHKTFCIPHGGGGPGMGPIGVAAHLAPHLPGHPVIKTGGEQPIGPISAAPFGSASILPISYMYIAMMGSQGLADASRYAILGANYMAKRLSDRFDVLYTGANGRVAHEFIIDTRPLKARAGIEAEDIAKRLMDYGFHAPTMSFPVAGTLMVEPTESEAKEELDRFCEAMLRIADEIEKVERGEWPRDDNPLKNAPHTAAAVMADEWTHPYTREEAAFGAPWVRESKYWPTVGRVDNAFGDRNLICSCPPLEAYAAQ